MKKRPLCIATIYYMIGIVMGLYLKISMVFLLCCSVVCSVCLYCVLRNKRLVVFVLIMILGFLSIKVLDYRYESQYEFFEADEEYKIEAIIVSDIEEKEYKQVCQIEVKEINGNTEYKGKRWLLNIKKSKNIDSSVESNLNFGDDISFYGRIEIPSTARNYMGFDYQKYLKSQQLYGTMIAKNGVKVQECNQPKTLEKLWYDIRADMKKRLYYFLPQDAREVCLGILIGEREDITENLINSFKESNLMHMLAVSGAHISYIVLGVTVILRKIGFRFRKIFIIVFLLFFMGLTDFTPSVQRASLMLILTLIANLIYRKQDIYTNICFSSLMILLYNPYVILNIGFQLSYGGTIGIVLFYRKISDWIKSRFRLNKDGADDTFNMKNICVDKSKSQEKEMQKIGLFSKFFTYIGNTIAVTISANLVIIPIMAFHFNTISFTFWISNLLAGPLLGFITILGFLLYFISLLSMTVGNLISIPVKYLIYLLIWIAKFCSQIPFSSIMIRTPFILEMFLYYFSLFVFFHFSYFKKSFSKMMSIVFVLMILFYGSLGFRNYGSLKIYFVDVGQGDCTLICTPTNKTILIDGGGSETESFDVGEKTLLPYLLDRKIIKIDYMMISHFDTDHVGGLLYLLEKIEIKNVIISKQGDFCENYYKLKEIVLEKNIPVLVVKQGDRLKVDKMVYFDILFPEDSLISDNVLNNNSIVAKLNYGSFSMMFTGDIEEIAEKKLIEMYKDTSLLKSTVLKVAHHGSNSSSMQEILELIYPDIALLGVGEKNTFGHPNTGVLERLESLNTKTYRTDLYGEINIIVDKNGNIQLRKLIDSD